MGNITTTAPAKLILFGEHAAVYGYPAIGFPLPWKLSLSLAPCQKINWEFSNLNQKQTKQLDDLTQHLQVVFPELKKTTPIKIALSSETPIGIGMGSSGALCTALSKALFKYLNLDNKFPSELETKHAMWRYAHELEKIFHGTPSGIDTGISTFALPCYFKGKKDGLPEFFPLKKRPLSLVIGALPRTSDTKTLVNRLKSEKENIESQISHLGAISSKAIQCFLYKPLQFEKEIGLLANQAHHILATLGFSTPQLDQMLNAGISLGALGGKLSGAGSGGTYFLVSENPNHAQHLAENLKKSALENSIHHVFQPTAIHFG